mmetsp:Transcript_2377/g.5857  ORF Transcript_2377/g.5857 Transcript_2377/m.5857 type:complete len:283 (+) Transcript_2377:2174-3022(+)
MVLEVHCGTVEGSSVVAPKCEEAAAINLARHFTAAVLKAGVHRGSIRAKFEARCLVVEIFLVVRLEDGVALTFRIDGVNSRSLTPIFCEIEEVIVLAIPHQLIGLVLEFSAVERVFVGGARLVGPIVQIEDVELEEPLGYEVQHAFLVIDTLEVWIILLLRKTSQGLIAAPGESRVIQKYEEFRISPVSVERVPISGGTRLHGWRRSVPSENSCLVVLGDKEDGVGWIPIVAGDGFVVASLPSQLRFRGSTMMLAGWIRINLPALTLAVLFAAHEGSPGSCS